MIRSHADITDADGCMALLRSIVVNVLRPHVYLKVQVPNNHTLSQKVTYIATMRNPST